jgi:Ca2+/Na+ antiporter
MHLHCADTADYFMAPSRKILDSVVLKMEEIMERRASESGDTSDDHNPTSVNNDEAVNSFEERSLIEFPTDGFVHEILLYVFLFPFKFLMHHTIPDVRTFSPGGDPTASLFTALMAVIACLLWLIVASYAMVTSLTDLADLMNIPDAVMGVTLAAAGTSLPNYVASKVAAEQGFGNMAVSNAFGSNTFNIMVGLGLPWTLYIAFGNNFQPYHGLRDEGITESVIILASVLLVFVVLVLFSDFVLYKWHGYMFMTLYVAYLGYAVIRFM